MAPELSAILRTVLSWIIVVLCYWVVMIDVMIKRLRLLIGLTGVMVTESFSLAPISLWTKYFLVRLTVFLYMGCCHLVSTATVAVLVSLVEMTVPISGFMLLDLE